MRRCTSMFVCRSKEHSFDSWLLHKSVASFVRLPERSVAPGLPAVFPSVGVRSRWRSSPPPPPKGSCFEDSRTRGGPLLGPLWPPRGARGSQALVRKECQKGDQPKW
ncbi:hypothetical protein JTE90_010831 [Oedothorax gibbosus]|uniref:Uncharacterized protein n=1 Tax=Oedothorax gibbosus TaxID=931172 RepID=A0AAV6V3Y3_9ARAC|nr:hypothetical protein JTE90_010831 [Oedothorax gibbosus]